MIEVCDYDPRWPARFDALRARYVAALADADVEVVGIEHVGSTSVPGLSAKPIIDIDIIVAPHKVEPAIEALERIGFESLGERGIEGRWAHRAPADLPPTNTYVIVDGSLALRNHLSVRDALRDDSALRQEYGTLKRAIAAEVTDTADYVERKSAFLTRVLEQSGLSDDERRSITDANRAP